MKAVARDDMGWLELGGFWAPTGLRWRDDAETFVRMKCGWQAMTCAVAFVLGDDEWGPFSHHFI